MSNKESFLLYSKDHPAMIKGISVTSGNTFVEEVIAPITGLNHPTALDFDIEDQFIYFVNGQAGRT